MRLLQSALLLVALCIVGVGETDASRRAEGARADPLTSCEVSATGAAVGETVAQQACCKANKGVCGCRAGKIVCCDKTFSDTCTCNRDEAPDGIH